MGTNLKNMNRSVQTAALMEMNHGSKCSVIVVFTKNHNGSFFQRISINNRLKSIDKDNGKVFMTHK